MNKVILMGRLTRDPDARTYQGENAGQVARFTLAVDRRFKRDGSEQSADFISCVAFGKTAEFIEKYTKQGTKLCVEGRIQTGSYTNKDNQKVYTTDVVVENAEFAESKGSGNAAQGAAPVQQRNFTQSAQDPMPAPEVVSNEGFMSIPEGLDDEGLPFN